MNAPIKLTHQELKNAPIDAIKSIRKRLGVPLKEAKAIYDREMAKLPKPTRDTEAADRYHTIVRGWQDGATARAYRIDPYGSHPLRELYLEAYHDGLKALGEQKKWATACTKYAPTILRGQR